MVSLRTLERHFHVYYDSRRNGGAFICETDNGQIVFKRCEKTGFPYIDLDDHENDAAVLMVQAAQKNEGIKTVRKNFSGYTRREVERAIAARKLSDKQEGLQERGES